MQLFIKSARFQLWPAIFLNTCAACYSDSGSLEAGLLLSIALGCLASFGFLINDLNDVDVDRINCANRLEHASVADKQRIKWAALCLAVAGLMTASLLGLEAFFCLFLVCAGLIYYTYRARPIFMFGTALAGLLSLSPLWVPDLLFLKEPNWTHLLLISIAFLLLFARELIFDAKDALGDSVGLRRTVATVYGGDAAIAVSFILHIAGVAAMGFVILRMINTQVSALFFLFSLVSFAFFAWLLLWPAFQLMKGRIREDSFRTFTRRSRLAMLLLPLFWIGL